MMGGTEGSFRGTGGFSSLLEMKGTFRVHATSSKAPPRILQKWGDGKNIRVREMSGVFGKLSSEQIGAISTG